MARIQVDLSEEEVEQAIKDYVAEKWNFEEVSSPFKPRLNTTIDVRWSPEGPSITPNHTCRVVVAVGEPTIQAPLVPRPDWAELVNSTQPEPPLPHVEPESTSDPESNYQHNLEPSDDDDDIPF